MSIPPLFFLVDSGAGRVYIPPFPTPQTRLTHPRPRSIRATNSSRPSSSSGGTEFLPETYIRVRFAWLAFVAAQVALSVVFLAGIVVQTAVWDVEVVKGAGSAAAVLMAVSADDRARVGEVREVPARLVREGGGRWRLALEPGGEEDGGGR